MSVLTRSTSTGLAIKDTALVCTTFNSVLWLRELVAALLLLDPPPNEYVFVDDASSDGTQEVLAKLLPTLSEAGCEVVQKNRRENGGSAVARNEGLRSTGARFVAFLDGDDLPLPWRILDTERMFRSHPGIGLVYGPIAGIERGSIQFVRGGRRYAQHDCARVLQHRNFVPFSTVCIDRSLVEAEFDEAIRSSEDYLFLVEAASRTDFRATERPITLYRIHDHAKSANIDAKIVTTREALSVSGILHNENWVPLPLLVQRARTDRTTRSFGRLLHGVFTNLPDTWHFRHELFDFGVSRIRPRSRFETAYAEIKRVAQLLPQT